VSEEGARFRWSDESGALGYSGPQAPQQQPQ
jgi:hypothetical protein